MNIEEVPKNLQQQVQEQVRDVMESPQAVRPASPALKEEEGGEDTGAKVWIVQEEGQQEQENIVAMAPKKKCRKRSSAGPSAQGHSFSDSDDESAAAAAPCRPLKRPRRSRRKPQRRSHDSTAADSDELRDVLDGDGISSEDEDGKDDSDRSYRGEEDAYGRLATDCGGCGGGWKEPMTSCEECLKFFHDKCTGLGSKDEDGTWQCVGCSAKRPPANNPPPSSSTATITPKIPTPEPPIKPTVAPAPLAPPGSKVAKKVKQAVIRPIPRGSRGRGGGRGSSWSASRRGRTTPPILKPVIPRPSSAQQQEHERLFSCVEAAAAQLPDGIVLDQEASTFYIGGGEELSLAQMLSVLCRAEKGEVPTRKTPLGIQQLSGLEEGSLKVFAFRAEGGGPVESEGWRRDGLSETGGKGKCDVRVQRFQAGFSAFERASDLSSSDSDFRRRGVWTSADPSLVAVQYTVLRRRQSEKKQEEVSPQPQLRIKILASTPKEDEDEDDIVVEEEFPAGRSCTPLSVSPIEAAGTPRSRERERMLLKLPKSTTIALERQGKGVEGSASQPEVQVLAPEKKPRPEVINIESEEEREDGCDDIIVCGEEETRAKLPPKPPSYQRKLPPGIVCTRVERKQQHEPRKEIPVVTAAASTPPTLTGSQETAPKLVVVATASLPPATPEKSKEVPERRPSPVSSVSKPTPPTPAKKNPPSISPRSDSRSSSSDISVKKKRVPARKGLEDIRKRFKESLKAEMLQQLRRRRSRDISEEEQQEGPQEKRAAEEEAPPKPIFEEKMEEGGGSRQPEQIASSSPTPLSPPPPPEQKSASAVGNEKKEEDEKAEAESGGSSKTMMHAAQEEKDEKAKPENSDDRSDKEGEEEADGVVRISIPREELDTLKRLGFSILD